MPVVRLPPEVWQPIIRYATDSPDLLSTTWGYEPDLQLWQGWAEDDNSRVELRTKLSIVHVCRAWRDMSIEYLYEVIHIPHSNNRSQVDSLVATFSDSAAVSLTGKGYGWWIKRITCSDRFLSLYHIDQLFPLLQRCQNLQTFSFSTTYPNLHPQKQNQLVQLLEHRFYHSLRRVEFYTSSDSDSWRNERTIPQVAGLTSLGITLPQVTSSDSQAPPQSLTSLSINFPDSLTSFPSGWEFLSLKNLSIQNISRQNFGHLIPFIKRHQTTLVNLHISSRSAVGVMIASLVSSAPEVSSISLDDVGLYTFDTRQRIGITLLRLTHLGITCVTQNRDSLLRAKLGLLRVIGGELVPNIKVVRFLNATSPVNSESSSTWLQMIEGCKNVGVRLEDRRGKLICVGTPRI